MTKITAIIPTLNEEKNVSHALKSLSFVDEIIVIDSFSTDTTVDIAKSYGAKVIQRKFDDFSNQKNFAIQQAKNDWIFLLDADEVANENLQKEVIEKANNPEGYAGFYIYRRFYFKGKNLKYSGWRHDKVIRLFNKNSCKYKGKVHEKIVSDGEIGFLKNKIEHYSLKDIKRYKGKLKFYASLQALELYERHQIVTPYHTAIKPLARFVIQYFIKLGFLDGAYGFSICRLHAYGVYMRYKNLLRIRYKKKRDGNYHFQFKNQTPSVDLSIVIVNYKSWTHLEQCLISLLSLSKLKFSSEVIVVDNCSDDGKLEEFKEKFHSIQFVKNSGNNGFANGCNTGASLAKGEHILFLNPDTKANTEAIRKMLAYSRSHEKVGIISCLQKNENGFYESIVRLFPNSFTLFGLTRAIYKFFNYKKLSNRYNSLDELAFPDWVSGSLVLIRRNWFEKINAWNEDYWMYFEDVDLSKKVRENGGEVALLESTEIMHSHGGASRINFNTASLTKTEVIISKHVYIHNHFRGLHKIILQFLIIINVLISRLLFGLLGLIFFFIPKLKLQLYIGLRVLGYYVYSIRFRTWLSPRSMNYKMN